jgi:hypothetical protein
VEGLRVVLFGELNDFVLRDEIRALGALTLSNVENRENDDVVTGVPWADRWVDIEPSQSPIIARRVHIVQVPPTPVIEHKSAPMVSPHDVVVLAFIALILTLGTIEAVYRNEP